MEKTTKTILIVSSVLALGGIAFLIFKKKKPTIDTSSLNSGDVTTTPQTQTQLIQPTKPNVLGSLGLEVPKMKPLVLPSLKDMLKGTNWLKIGEQVPSKTSTTLTTPPSSNYGIDQTKLAQWNAKYGTK